MREPLRCRRPKCVVTRIPAALDLRDVAKIRTRQYRACRRQPLKWTCAVDGLIEIATRDQMCALRTEETNRQSKIAKHFALDVEIPRLQISVIEVVRD